MLVGLHRAFQGFYSAPLTGTPIGDMTGLGGLAAAFDGNGNQGATNCAQKGAATDAYIGLSFASQRRVALGRLVGANDQGIHQSGGGEPNVTLTLYGKTGAAPASRTDGTNLGSLTFVDTANESETLLNRRREIISNQPFTLWDHVWFSITHDGSAVQLFCAECRLFETA